MIELTFGAVEAVLAEFVGIASDKRTAFQARLKNFHKLGFPAGMAVGRGKSYSASDVILMAVAVELTQLGLMPERLVSLLDESDIQVGMVFAIARYLDKTERPDEFLYCDPTALTALMDDGTPTQARYGTPDQAPAWRRIASVNLTMLFRDLARAIPEAKREAFVSSAKAWAVAVVTPEEKEPQNGNG